MMTETENPKTFHVYLSETDAEGAFNCPNCQSLIHPDDESLNNYLIKNSCVIEGSLQEVWIYCVKCGSTVILKFQDKGES